MKIRSHSFSAGLAGLALGLVLLGEPCCFASPDSSDVGRPQGFLQQFDQDGDGKVSMKEFPTPEKLFASLDSNGDGYLDASEAPKGPSRDEGGPPAGAARDCGPHMGPHRGGWARPEGPPPGPPAMSFMEQFDEDGDGKISLKEFPTPEKRFAKLDANRDGYLDPTEVPKGPPHGNCGPCGPPPGAPRADCPPPPNPSCMEMGPPIGPPPGRPAASFIQQFDEDGDGKVSLKEFTTPEKPFAVLDSNGDGYIDATEAPKGPPRSDAAAKGQS